MPIAVATFRPKLGAECFTYFPIDYRFLNVVSLSESSNTIGYVDYVVDAIGERSTDWFGKVTITGQTINHLVFFFVCLRVELCVF